MVDAVLSNANEPLAIGSCVLDANAHTSLRLDISTAIEQVSNRFTDRFERAAEEAKQKIQIPTAIVKPKYQKAAFDDRQLPIIARVDRNQPWYDKQGAPIDNSANKTTPRKVIPLPDCERKVKKRSKQHQSNSVKSAHTDSTVDSSNQTKMISVCSSKCSATKEQTKALDASEKDTNSRRCGERKSSTVAIVQPRKKEKMDERKLMETIVQMQIKKNSMDNRNNNQRNVTRVAPMTTMAKTSKPMTSESPKDTSGISCDPMTVKLLIFISDFIALKCHCSGQF